MRDKTQTAPRVGDADGGNKEQADDMMFDYGYLTISTQPVSTATLAHAAQLHENLGFFYLDRCAEFVDTVDGQFGYWFGLMLGELTYSEVLRRDGG